MSSRTCQFSNKNISEFIPATSDSSAEHRPLDEIGLMKHGLLEKRSYNRQMGAKMGPVTMEEIMKRGIQTMDGEIVHAMPIGSRTTSAVSSGSSFTSSSSLQSTYAPTISSTSSDYAVFSGKLKNETVHKVGLPEEGALLKIGESKNGKRYQLTAANGLQVLLDTSPENSLLLIFK